MGRPMKERAYFLGLVVFIARAGSLDRVFFWLAPLFSSCLPTSFLPQPPFSHGFGVAFAIEFLHPRFDLFRVYQDGFSHLCDGMQASHSQGADECANPDAKNLFGFT
jgi:hypothetical protein